MKGWLGKFLDQCNVDEQAFLKAYDSLGSGADKRYIRKLLKENKQSNVFELLRDINVKPQDRLFDNIANALRSAISDTEVTSPDAQDIRVFHERWQTSMRYEFDPIVKRITQLNEDGFALRQLVSISDASDPVRSYASCLNTLLLSPENNGKKLIAQIERMLRIADQNHIEHIVELTTLMAYHFIPKSLWKSRRSNGVTIGSDEPAPAVYRMIQNWRNGVVSQFCEYEGREGGVRGAVPLSRKALSTDDFVSGIAELLDNRIDDQHLANVGQDGYEIKRRAYSQREFKGLDRRLYLESETPHSRFVYCMNPGVLDTDSAETLEKVLPSLKHYSHQPEESTDVAEVIDLDSFLKNAGEMIDERIQSFEAGDALTELSRLVAAELKSHGKSSMLAEAPESKDPVKYLKYLNELLKTEKYLSGIATRHPELVEKVSGMVSGAVDFSTAHYSEIASLLKNIRLGAGQ